MNYRLTGAVLAALCLTAPAQAAVFLRMGCGYALYRPCLVDPSSYGEPRTTAGCQALAVRLGERPECVEVKGK